MQQIGTPQSAQAAQTVATRCLGQGLQADTASMDLPTGRCARQRSITANAAAAENEEDFGKRREP